MSTSHRELDLICLGRAAVDLYGEQIGSPLEDVQSFAKSLGGSAANVAVGAARLGLKVAMLTRVGDEHMGRFVRQQLAREGVDVSHVKTDPDRLTGLVLLSVRDRQTFPLIFYRERCADMAICTEDFDEAFIGRARALLVNGTHFSTAETDAASRAAMAFARAQRTKVVLDIDYRPVLWGLTGHGLGEERFVASGKVSAHLLSLVAECDLVVGTEEEIHIAGGSTNTLEALRAIRARTTAPIVMKRGPLGCVVFEGEIPGRVEDGFVASGVRVEVLNVLGGGDAFLAGLLRGWVRGESWENACRYANACGALVVSRHACSVAMPTRVELDDYLQRQHHIPRIDRDEKIARLHRVTTRRPAPDELWVLAFDHRRQLEALADEAGAERGRLFRLKRLIADGGLVAAVRVGHERVGMIVDEQLGREVLDDLTDRVAWLARPIEEPGGPPLPFVGGPDVASELRRWPRSHVVKCLVVLHPRMDAATRNTGISSLRMLQAAAQALDRTLLIEVIPGLAGAPMEPETLPDTLEALYAEGIRPDWWKIPPPRSAALWAQLQAVITAHDPWLQGILLLGADAPEADLAEGMRSASGIALCRGFAVGRTIFGAPSRAWLANELSDAALVAEIAERFERVISHWRARGA